MQVNRCLSIKGAEDILNKPHAFEVSTTDDSMFFIADTDKVRVDSSSVGIVYTCSTCRIFATLAGCKRFLLASGEGGLDQCSRTGYCAPLQKVSQPLMHKLLKAGEMGCAHDSAVYSPCGTLLGCSVALAARKG